MENIEVTKVTYKVSVSGVEWISLELAELNKI